MKVDSYLIYVIKDIHCSLQYFNNMKINPYYSRSKFLNFQQNVEFKNNLSFRLSAEN